MSKSIKQTVKFKAPPRAVFEALMDPKQHARFTGGPARISRKLGSAFSVHGGYATGYLLDLVADKRIVQAWRASDWPKGSFSIVTFALAPAPGKQTVLTFSHDCVPDIEAAGIKQGWIDFYWRPLEMMLEGA